MIICDVVAFLVLFAIAGYVLILFSRLKNAEDFEKSTPSKKQLNILMGVLIASIILVFGLIVLNTVVALRIFLK